MTDQPSLPYGGSTNPNSGWAGSETSAARARAEDASGVTARRQRDVLALLRAAGTRGMTWREVADALVMHHGQASGALSGLHKAGRITRLAETRLRCSVYVTPEFLNSRGSFSQGNTSTTRLLNDMAGLLRRHEHDCVHGPLPEPGCLHCDTKDVLRRYEART